MGKTYNFTRTYDGQWNNQANWDVPTAPDGTYPGQAAGPDTVVTTTTVQGFTISHPLTSLTLGGSLFVPADCLVSAGTVTVSANNSIKVPDIYTFTAGAVILHGEVSGTPATKYVNLVCDSLTVATDGCLGSPTGPKGAQFDIGAGGLTIVGSGKVYLQANSTCAGDVDVAGGATLAGCGMSRTLTLDGGSGDHYLTVPASQAGSNISITINSTGTYHAVGVLFGYIPTITAGVFDLGTCNCFANISLPFAPSSNTFKVTLGTVSGKFSGFAAVLGNATSTLVIVPGTGFANGTFTLVATSIGGTGSFTLDTSNCPAGHDYAQAWVGNDLILTVSTTPNGPGAPGDVIGNGIVV